MSLAFPHRSRHIDVATWHNIIITVSRGTLPIEELAPIEDTQKALLRLFPSGLVSLSIVPAGTDAGIPDAEFRAAAAAMTERWEPHFLGIARVVETEGFTGSAVRGVLTGIDFLARSKVRTSVFRDRAEAARWISRLPRVPEEVRFGHDALAAALSKL